MLTEIAAIAPVRHFYTSAHSSFVLDSIAEGHTRAALYVDNPSAVGVNVIWDRGNCFYFAGDAPRNEKAKAVQYIRGTILDGATRQRLQAAKLCYSSEEWKDLLAAAFQTFKPILLERRLYAHWLSGTAAKQQISVGIPIQPITDTILRRRDLRDIEQLTHEIEKMWGSLDAFLRHGFGVCAVDGDKLVCWCTAEYLSKGHCGIGVETVEDYQGRGLATSAATQFIGMCRERQVLPYWDCWRNNRPSVRVAEKVGFEQVEEYSVLLVRFAG